MIASLKSERLKTPNEGSKPKFYLRWIRELVPMNAHLVTYLDRGMESFLDCIWTRRARSSSRRIVGSNQASTTKISSLLAASVSPATRSSSRSKGSSKSLQRMQKTGLLTRVADEDEQTPFASQAHQEGASDGPPDCIHVDQTRAGFRRRSRSADDGGLYQHSRNNPAVDCRSRPA
jgi:hypothetical protein